MKSACIILGLACTLLSAAALAERRAIPLAEGSAATLYVEVEVTGLESRAFLVDTGSSYSVLDAATLADLRSRGLATLVRRVQGTMADGRQRRVPVYSVAGLTLGGACHLQDVEVAALPGRERPILGINALRRLAPVVFLMDPPSLSAGGCTAWSAIRGEQGRGASSLES